MLNKEQRQLLEQAVTHRKLKIRIVELYNNWVKITIENPVNVSWLDFLNNLQINARSLVNFDRRMKFANAITHSDSNVLCICETWWNKNNESAELLLHNNNLYRSDRRLQKDTNTHGFVMVAIKSIINC